MTDQSSRAATRDEEAVPVEPRRLVHWHQPCATAEEAKAWLAGVVDGTEIVNGYDIHMVGWETPEKVLLVAVTGCGPTSAAHADQIVAALNSAESETATHTDHHSRHWDRTCSACVGETGEPFVKAVTVTLPDGSPVAAPCAISGCQYGKALPSAGAESIAAKYFGSLASEATAADWAAVVGQLERELAEERFEHEETKRDLYDERKASLKSAASATRRSVQALEWAHATFGEVAGHPEERAARFIEEAIELVQAVGLPVDLVDAIAGRVYLRPAGQVSKEVGQAMVTLETLAEVMGVVAESEADREFARIKAIPQEEWSRRHQAKVDLGIANVRAADSTARDK